MNTAKDDGGSAFPGIINIESLPVRDLDRQGRLVHPVAMRGGMTLRDWLAGQALTGLLASETRGEGLLPCFKGSRDEWRETAAKGNHET